MEGPPTGLLAEGFRCLEECCGVCCSMLITRTIRNKHSYSFSRKVTVRRRQALYISRRRVMCHEIDNARTSLIVKLFAVSKFVGKDMCNNRSDDKQINKNSTNLLLRL